MSTMRKPFFIIALVLFILAFLIETGSSFFVLDSSTIGQGNIKNPGIGIPYLALLDGLLLFGVGMIGMGLLLPDWIHGRLQGISTLIVSLLVLLLSLVKIFAALALLMLMVSLLLAVPFGTAVYFTKYATFNTFAASTTLSAIMTLKLAAVVLLLLAHEGFLGMKSLVLMILTSLLGTVIVSMLHGFAPVSFVVSITDGIAAIIVAVLALVWALILLTGSVPAVVKSLRVDRALAP